MKNLILLFGLILLPVAGFNQLIYSKVKIYATNAELETIGSLGVTIDHGERKSNEWFITDLSSLDVQILSDHGIVHEILIPDVATYYATHSLDADPRSDRADCVASGSDDPSLLVTPSNFSLGSMGGYFTYEEFLAELDAMRHAYPELITDKAPISTFTTWEGRPIHWVRISDNAEIDESEHEVLYTAVHHAREPMGLSQTIFYMWYLLENYGTNPEVTYLVDHTEMYFVPMINPDGYRYNQTTNPSGGGMHRKNRNPSVGTTNKGVDLNRNYSYHWNESGTTPDENGDTYAGSMAFSEPETQAIKWFCENHDFQFASNAHSYGDLVLFPIGWATEEYAVDHDYFFRYTNHMTLYNSFIAEKATDLYPAAGDSDDWMYIDESTAIFAMTPEIGGSFWPSSAQIIPTCKLMIWTNLVMAHMPHIYGITTDLEASRIESTTGYFNYKIERLGLQDGDITVSMTPITGISTLGSPNIHSLSVMELVEDSISFELNGDIAFGDEIKFVLSTSNGLWTRNDTLVKIYGGGTSIFFDDCSDLTNWIGAWDLTNEIYYSPSNCITDSPYDGTYGNNVNKKITLDQSFNFEHATYAYATFNAQWEIENDYDYVEFMASSDGGTSWTALCGKYTNNGVEDQDLDQPLYDGAQADWVLEEVDLSDYIDEADVRFRFLLITDAGLQMDGFYFDDFSIFTDAHPLDESGIENLDFADFKLYPNPATNQLNLQFNADIALSSIVIYSEIGEKMKELNGTVSTIELKDWSNGIYFIQFIDDKGQSLTKRFTVVH